jgi:hypothetical protein
MLITPLKFSHDDSDLPIPDKGLFEDLAEALECFTDLSEIVVDQAEQEQLSRHISRVKEEKDLKGK